MLREPELEPNSATDTRLDIDVQYLGTAANVRIRNALYDRYTEDGRQLHSEILPYIGNKPNEVVLDVGCADGKLILEAAKNITSPTNFIGLDLDDNLVRLNRKVVINPHNLNFMQGNVNAIGLTDSSIDTVLAMFMLYHSNDPAGALSELHRVLRPDGQLIVATSGSLNKLKHRQFERAIADELDLDPPPIFAEPFNAEKAPDFLSKDFEIAEIIPQETQLVISDEDSLETYLLSLTSMKSSFSVDLGIRAWNSILDDIVKPVIQKEIDHAGAFTDSVARYIYICRPQAKQ